MFVARVSSQKPKFNRRIGTGEIKVGMVIQNSFQVDDRMMDAAAAHLISTAEFRWLLQRGGLPGGGRRVLRGGADGGGKPRGTRGRSCLRGLEIIDLPSTQVSPRGGTVQGSIWPNRLPVPLNAVGISALESR